MSKGAVNFEPLNPLVTLPLSGARVIYEPSVYLGDGTEVRKNIVLEVSPEALEIIRGHETSIDASRVCSCIKDDALKAHGATFNMKPARSKLNGERKLSMRKADELIKRPRPCDK